MVSKKPVINSPGIYSCKTYDLAFQLTIRNSIIKKSSVSNDCTLSSLQSYFFNTLKK